MIFIILIYLLYEFLNDIDLVRKSENQENAHFDIEKNNSFSNILGKREDFTS